MWTSTVSRRSDHLLLSNKPSDEHLRRSGRYPRRIQEGLGGRGLGAPYEGASGFWGWGRGIETDAPKGEHSIVVRGAG